MTTLDEVDVALVSTTQSIDTSTPTGRLMRNILVDFAGFERDMIVERTRGAMAQLWEQGTLISGVVPFGFLAELLALSRHPIVDPLLDGQSCSRLASSSSRCLLRSSASFFCVSASFAFRSFRVS